MGEETIIEVEEVAEPESIVGTATPDEESSEETGSEEEASKEDTAEKTAADFIAEAEITAQEDATALKKSVVSRIASVTEKLKSSAVTKQNVKKTAVLASAFGVLQRV